MDDFLGEEISGWFDHRIRWRSGEEVDEKLMMVLHSFRELYMKRGEFFKKIFPQQLHDAFGDVFKKIDAAVKKKDQMKKKSLQRSSSVGSPCPRGLQQDDESELRLHLFKVRTPDVAVVQPGGQGGGKDPK